jgi:hypothetical protein
MQVAVVCLLVTLAVAWGSPANADITYSGRAFGAFVNAPLLGINTTLSDTGQLPPSGGFQSADLATAGVPNILSANLLVASTSGANGVARSDASLADLMVLPGQPAQVTASLVRAESEASCNGVRGATEVVNATFGGQAIAVDPFAPNQTFQIPGVATLIINEQKMTSGGGVQDITVNAIHLTVFSPVAAEVIVSSAHSDVQGCPGCAPTPACADFITGGGAINVESGQASFGMNAGFKPNATTPEIHFNYIDHSSGMHVKATSISVYSQGNTPTSRHMEGSAEVDGMAGFTYVLDVADNGEPGRNVYTLQISLSNGYSAGGPLVDGNLQLHKPACKR